MSDKKDEESSPNVKKTPQSQQEDENENEEASTSTSAPQHRTQTPANRAATDVREESDTSVYYTALESLTSIGPVAVPKKIQIVDTAKPDKEATDSSISQLQTDIDEEDTESSQTEREIKRLKEAQRVKIIQKLSSSSLSSFSDDRYPTSSGHDPDTKSIALTPNDMLERLEGISSDELEVLAKSAIVPLDENYQNAKSQLIMNDAVSYRGLQKGYAFIYMVIPPDGGYGWIILIVSFLCQVVVDGIVFSIGIALPYMAEDLGVASNVIVYIASMQIGFYFLSGPLTSAFINKYGFRPVCLMGAFFSFVFIIIATFMPTLITVLIFYSILAGPTLSMIWVSSQLIIGFYFESYRPIANGLSCSGAGVGMLLFSGINTVLEPLIGWRNTSRVHCLFLILVFFMGMTFVEVKPTKVAEVFAQQENYDSDVEDSEVDELLQEATHYSGATGDSKAFHGVSSLAEQKPQKRKSVKRPNFFKRIFYTCCPFARESKSSESLQEKRFVIRPDPIEKQDLYYMGPADYRHYTDEGRKMSGQSTLKQKSIMSSISLKKSSADFRRSVQYEMSMIRLKSEETQRKTDYKNLSKTKKFFYYLSPVNWLPYKIVRAFKVLFDMRLMANMEFRILLLSAFFYPMGFNIPFVYSKSRASLPGFYVNLISPLIGFSNFAFRIASGFIAQQYKESATYVCGGGIAFGGLAVFISAFYGYNVVWFQLLYAICYGVAPAFYSTLRAIIYVRYLGLDRLTNVFGLTAMSMGLGVFLGTTFAGIMNFYTGGYSASFCFSGICMMLAGSLKMILPTLIKRKKKRLKS